MPLSHAEGVASSVLAFSSCSRTLLYAPTAQAAAVLSGQAGGIYSLSTAGEKDDPPYFRHVHKLLDAYKILWILDLHPKAKNIHGHAYGMRNGEGPSENSQRQTS